jgi:hypothetical protein
MTKIHQALLELRDDGSEIVDMRIQPSMRHEKNWMPCVTDEGLKLIYSVDPLVVLNVDKHRRVTPDTSTIAQVNGHVRGGSQLIPYENSWLAVVHQTYKKPDVNASPARKAAWPKDERVVYVHRFALFDKNLTGVRLGEPFYFMHRGIEFCAGLAWHEGKLVAAFGVRDAEAWLATFSSETVDATFESSEAL